MIDQRGLINQRAIQRVYVGCERPECLHRFWVNLRVCNLLDLMFNIRVKSKDIEFIECLNSKMILRILQYLLKHG